ncbi:MAG: exported protein of unknown function [Klenkia sp.]|nr:exported protein of unknown function [Klenkia sp.]
MTGERGISPASIPVAPGLHGEFYVRPASSAHRALGLLAASALGMSTVVVVSTGVASAAPTPAAFTFSTDSGATSAVVPAGYCAIDWVVLGARGGASEEGTPGEPGGLVTTRVTVREGDVFLLYPGSPGGDAGVGAPGVGGASGASDPSAAGTNGGLNGTASGGGGAGSVVERLAVPVVGAFGGDGAASAGIPGGTGGGTNFAPGTVDQTRTGAAGVGSISGTGVLCATPAAPGDLVVDQSFRVLDITFDEPVFTDETDRADDFEISYDGGTTWAALDVFYPGDGSGGVGARILDPAPGRYDIVVRGTNEAGNGAASAEVSVLVLAPATDVTATVGVSSILVTFVEPADTTGISGYQAFASPVGAQSSADLVVCDVPLGVTSCLLGVPAGIAYGVGVGSIDVQGEFGAAVYAEDTGIVPGPAVPTAVPTRDDGDVVGPVGPISSVVAGQTSTVIGSGFLPFSTVQLSLLPGPVDLGTVVADENGAFSLSVTIPASLANGSYSIVATGTAPDGTARNLVTAVTLSGGTAVVTPARPAALAVTGFDTAVPLAGGALAVLAGVGMLVGARRRSTV